MNVREIKAFSGKWVSARRAIQFQWDLKCMENDRYVVICPIWDGKDSKIDSRKRYIFDSRSMQNPSPNSLYVKYDNVNHGVSKQRFFAVITNDSSEWDEDYLNAYCQRHRDSVVTVMLGCASIVYAAKVNTIGDASVVVISLNSDSNISQGVLGYQYVIDNMRIKIPFPDDIHIGENNYPQIAVPFGSEIQVVPFEDQFAGNLQIVRGDVDPLNKKKIDFIKLFKR